MMNRKLFGALVMSALGVTMISGASASAEEKAGSAPAAAAPEKGICINNECKGHSECMGNGNAGCAGENSCKGHGIKTAATAEDCARKSGKWKIEGKKAEDKKDAPRKLKKT